MVSSTGTFVSCKDYDDDIDNLQEQINKLATKEDMTSQIATLQAALDAAKTEAAAAKASAEQAVAKANSAESTATEAEKAAAQAVQQPYRCRAYSSMRMALTGQLWAAVTACGTSSGGMGPGSATARTPSMRNTAGHSPAHWVQPMHSSGSTNAFMQTPPCGKHCPFCRKLCLCKRFAVWYNKTAGNRQEERR